MPNINPLIFMQILKILLFIALIHPIQWTIALSPVSMYAGCGSGKNPSYINAQQCFHFRGSRLRIAVVGGGERGPLFSIRSLTDFFRDPLPRTWKQGFTCRGDWSLQMPEKDVLYIIPAGPVSSVHSLGGASYLLPV